MNNARGVRSCEPARDLDGVFQYVFELSRPLPMQVQRLARNELHRDEIHAVGRIDVKNLNDVRVIERRGGFRFLHKPPLRSALMFPSGRRI